MRRLKKLRPIALLLIVAYSGLLGTRCASSQEAPQYDQLKPIGEELPPAPPGFVPIRIVLLNFRNSANVTRFDVIPDGDYSEYIANAAPIAIPGATDDSDEFIDSTAESESDDSETESRLPAPIDSDERNEPVASDATGESVPDPDTVDSGAVAREITETTLFQSGRFEIIPEFQFRAKMNAARASGLDEAAAITSAAEALDVSYIVYGALTDFEIRQQQDYWKLPLWAIILAASFFIQDDDLRVFVWYTMVRIALVAPINSPVWDYGIQWNDLDINIDVAMNLRLVDARSGSVIYSDSESVTRVENVRNLNLMVWSSNRRIKITQSNAGRQIRYVAQALVRDLTESADAGQFHSRNSSPAKDRIQ